MQETNSSRMFIFDPCFGGMTGHWESYRKPLFTTASYTTLRVHADFNQVADLFLNNSKNILNRFYTEEAVQ